MMTQTMWLTCSSSNSESLTVTGWQHLDPQWHPWSKLLPNHLSDDGHVGYRLWRQLMGKPPGSIMHVFDANTILKFDKDILLGSWYNFNLKWGWPKLNAGCPLIHPVEITQIWLSSQNLHVQDNFSERLKEQNSYDSKARLFLWVGARIFWRIYFIGGRKKKKKKKFFP